VLYERKCAIGNNSDRKSIRNLSKQSIIHIRISLIGNSVKVIRTKILNENPFLIN